MAAYSSFITFNDDSVDKKTSYMLVLTFSKISENIVPAYMIRIVVAYLQEIFMNVDEYVTKRDDDYFTMYFPKIVIDADPIYMTIIHDLATIFNRANLDIKVEQIGFDTSPNEVSEDEGIPEYSQGDIEISMSDIKSCTELPPSANTLLSRVDQFRILLLYIEKIASRDPTFMRSNMIYIASAFYHSEKSKRYTNREELFVSRDKFIGLMSKLNVDSELSAHYFDEAKQYSYTTITLEEIISRHSNEMNTMITHYRQACIKQKIRALFNFNRYPNDPSDNDLWMTFSEFVRKDHFYADGSIFVLDENYCRKIIPSEMRKIINTFVTLVSEVKLSIKYEMYESDKSCDVEKLNTRYQRIVRQFESKTSAKFVADAIENYLHTKLRNQVQSKAIPFQDTVVMYDNGEIFMRKAFMEDQFTGCANISILGFGKLPSEQQAISDVRKALKQIFVYDENIKWFLKWCGSLLAHKPERCCLVMRGKKGGNAKTTIINVILNIFGAWGVQCRPDMLAPSGKSSSCTPFDMELKNKVIAVFTEPQKGIKYSSSAVKEMTGGDRKKGAAKYKDPEEFDQTAKPVILLNEMLEFDEVDSAMLDRLYILDCIGRYMPDATPADAERHIYPRNDSFWKDMTKHRALAHLIIYEGLPAYLEEGIKKTSLMEQALLAWRKNICAFARFIDFTQEYYEGRKCYTSARQTYAEFKRRNPTYTLTYDDFVYKFKETLNKEPILVGNEQYYTFYVPNCTDRLFPEEQKMKGF